MFYARIAVATCMEAADPRDGQTCPVFNAKLRLFENASAPVPPAEHPDDLTLTTIHSQHVPVANTTEQAIAVGDELLVGQTVDERWVIINGGTGAPRIQFVTTGQMANQQVAVKVLRVHGAAPDLSGGVLQYGSTLNVTDPFNLWAEVEPNATGWAYYVAQSADDPETTEVTEPTHPARYEIEECSLPIKEMEGTISTCLLKGNTGNINVTVTLSGDDIRSSYPNVDSPPELSESGVIQASNPYHLDAIANSRVFIRRVTNLHDSEPEDYTLGAGSATTAHWEIYKVQKKIARWIKVIYQSGDWQFAGGSTSVYDGFSPFGDGGCVPDIVFETMQCLPQEPTTGYAFYIPESHDYRVVSTISALLGEPGRHSFIKGSDSPGVDPIRANNCGISVRPQLEYTQSQIYGWGQGDTNSSDCTDPITETAYSVDMGFGSAQAMTGVQLTCGAACTFSAVADSSSPTGFSWDSGNCTGAGCGNCVPDSGRPPQPSGADDTYAGVCNNDLNEAGLCFSKAYFLYCGPPTGPTTGTTECIPTTDCPPDSGG